MTKILKIIIAGEERVGKTALLESFFPSFTAFESGMKYIVGVEFSVIRVSFFDQEIILQTWEFAALNRIRFILPEYCKDSSGVLLIFDLTKGYTLRALSEWLSLMQRNTVLKHIPIILVGTKKDLEKRIKLTEIVDFLIKYQIDGYIECSPKNGENIGVVFEILIRKVLEFEKLKTKGEKNLKNKINPEIYIYNGPTLNKFKVEKGDMESLTKEINLIYKRIAKNVRIFISYARPDSEKAVLLFNELSNFGFDVWFDQVSLLPGQLWENEIKKAIKDSEFFILLSSKNSVDKRGYIQKEIKFALEIYKEVPEGQIYVIPLRLDDCEIPPSLAPIQYVDLFPDWKVGIEKLIKAIHFQLNKKMVKRFSN